MAPSQEGPLRQKRHKRPKGPDLPQLLCKKRVALALAEARSRHELRHKRQKGRRVSLREPRRSHAPLLEKLEKLEKAPGLTEPLDLKRVSFALWEPAFPRDMLEKGCRVSGLPRGPRRSPERGQCKTATDGRSPTAPLPRYVGSTRERGERKGDRMAGALGTGDQRNAGATGSAHSLFS
jgi:hypothetical protein